MTVSEHKQTSISTRLSELAVQMAGLAARATIQIVEASAGLSPRGTWRLFAQGDQIGERVAMLEKITRTSVRNLQGKAPFDPLRRERVGNRHLRERNLVGHLITPPGPRMSLFASCHPGTWVGPSFIPALAIDEQLALFGGPANSAGEQTVWSCTSPEYVDEVCHLWEKAKEMSIPIWDVPGVIRLTERQITVAGLLIGGFTDSRIAKTFGVSQRTVSSEISVLCEALQAGSRFELGLALGEAVSTRVRAG